MPHLPLLTPTDGPGPSLADLAKLLDTVSFDNSSTKEGKEGLGDALGALVTAVTDWLAVESISIMLLDGRKPDLRLAGISGMRSSPVPTEHQEIGTHLTGIAFRDNQPVVQNQLDRDPIADQAMIAQWSRLLPSGALLSGAFFPFSEASGCSGVVRFFNRLDANGRVRKHGFLPSDEDNLLKVAQLISAWIAVIWDKWIDRHLRTTFSHLSSLREVEKQAQAAVLAATQIANCRAAALYLIEPTDPQHLRGVGFHGFRKHYPELRRFPTQGSVAAQVAETGKHSTIKDLASAPNIANRTIALNEGLVSCALLPTEGMRVPGCLAVFSAEPRTFSQQTIAYLGLLASFTGKLIEARTEEVHAHRLTKILAITSHSLRNPIAGINRYASRLRRAIKDQEATSDLLTFVDAVLEEKDRADKRIDMFLFAPRGVLELMGLDYGNVKVQDLVLQSIHRQRDAAEHRGIRFVVFDSIKRLPAIQADEAKLALVFENLIENAVKYSWEKKPIELRGQHSERWIEVTVCDQGLGIGEGMKEMIFHAFSRSPVLDRERYIRGTGLGLELARTIVEAHGGEISADSSPFVRSVGMKEDLQGYTTTFRVRLPRQGANS